MFYNNDGRQVGIGKTLKIYTVNFNPDASIPVKISCTCNLIGINDSYNSPPSYYCKTSQSLETQYGSEMYIPEFETITRVQIDGVWYNMGSDKNTPLVFRYRGGSTSYYYAALLNGKLCGSNICLAHVNALEYY